MLLSIRPCSSRGEWWDGEDAKGGGCQFHDGWPADDAKMKAHTTTPRRRVSVTATTMRICVIAATASAAPHSPCRISARRRSAIRPANYPRGERASRVRDSRYDGDARLHYLTTRPPQCSEQEDEWIIRWPKRSSISVQLRSFCWDLLSLQFVVGLRIRMLLT